MKHYLIVGGSSGIGQTLTQQLRDSGHHVTTASRHHADITWDVLQDAPDLSSLPDTIDGLVYAPGSINLKPFARLTDQDFLEDFSLNVLGAVRVVRALLPRLKQADQASVVLFSTVAVAQGMPFHTSVAASKGAIEGLTRSLAAELAPRIRVNAIAPSLTHTPLAGKLLNTDDKIKAAGERHPLRRIGQPEDIAALAAFLLSDASSWISGQIIAADGGMSALRI